MAIPIIVPRLGWSMDEGTFGEWLKRDGEVVRKGDMLFVLESDKASQEIESFDSGILHIPLESPRAGDTVVVGQVLGYLLAVGEAPPAGAGSAVSVESDTEQIEIGEHLTQKSTVMGTSLRSPGETRLATPRARRRARELGVDWSNIRGTGRDGRIRERDVVAVTRQSPSAGKVVPLSSAIRGAPPSEVPGTLHKASRIRRAIAQRMWAGAHQAAPVTLTTKVDASRLVQLRQRLKREYCGGSAPSYDVIIAKLVATALADCPQLNACWRDEGVFIYDEINFAIALDTESGLLAPVIRNVASLGLDELAQRWSALVQRVRAGTLTAADLQGGTFTITNLGMFGIDYFTPIINLPQTAVLGIGRIVDEPVVAGDRVIPGKTLSLSLTFDHRAIDGAPAARWLQQLSANVANIE